MNRRTTTTTLMSMALLFLAVSLPAGSAVAQQKQQVSVKVPAENNKYGPQQNIQVGDVPNHIVRVFEVHYSFPGADRFEPDDRIVWPLSLWSFGPSAT